METFPLTLFKMLPYNTCSSLIKRYKFKTSNTFAFSFYAPAIYNGVGHIASPLSVRPYVHTYVPYVLSCTYEKWFPGDIFWKHWCIGFIFHTQVHNHKIQVKFDYGQNPPIIIRVMALDPRIKNGFRAISFENSYVLDSYFIHMYIIIKYRSSSITGKIHQLSSELWPLIWVRKMVSGRYLLKTLMKWIHISYTGI